MSTDIEPYDAGTVVLPSLPAPSLHEADSATVLAYFRDGWRLNDWLFGAIQDTKWFYRQPDPLRNPLIFYLGHTAAFFINKLLLTGLIDHGVNEKIEALFAVGVDPSNPAELSCSAELWPDVDQVWQYRADVYDVVSYLIDRTTFDTKDGHQAYWAIMMGIEHDRIHFETSSVLFRQCPIEALRRPSDWQYAPANVTTHIEPRMLHMDAGRVRLGKSDDSSFGWDNEFGALVAEVPAFQISSHLVSNAEFREFVCDDGYCRKELWRNEGWRWKESQNIRHPKFWISRDDTTAYRAVFDELTMPEDWPVEVNHFEAQAFCRWKGRGMRLPSESEMRLATNQKANVAQQFNHNLAFGSPTPTGLNAVTGRLNDSYGNVWQLLSDNFYPLPGFKPHPLYLDFSRPYFGDQHKMLTGGAWATTGSAITPHYRLWFRPYFYQHAGFRTAQAIEGQ